MNHDAGRGSEGGDARVVAWICDARVGDPQAAGQRVRPLGLDFDAAALRVVVDDGWAVVPEHGAQVVRPLADQARQTDGAASLDVQVGWTQDASLCFCKHKDSAFI